MSSAAWFRRLLPYTPPEWARGCLNPPKHKLALGNFPTPVHSWSLPGVKPAEAGGPSLWIKREDYSGVELSGNKVRKLELLLARAVEDGADTIITVGGLQSNHCRATCAAARKLGLDSHVVLRVEDRSLPSDCDDDTLQSFVDMEGNLLVMQLAGARIHPYSRARFFEIGWRSIVKDLAEKLRAEGKRPHVVPVGGSCTLGTWGYLNAVDELKEQLAADEHLPDKLDQIFLATGSGGSLAGIATGVAMAGLEGTKVTGYAVCDTEAAFHEHTDEFLQDLGVGLNSRDIMEVVAAKGLGYSINTPEELQGIAQVALSSGVVLDGTYTGKAVVGFMRDYRADPAKYDGKQIMFWHTGGLLGTYSRAAELQETVSTLRAAM